VEPQDLIIIVVGAGTALSAAIGILWKSVMDLSKNLTQTNKQLGILEGRQEGIQNLSKQVLDTVHRAVTARDSVPPFNTNVKKKIIYNDS